MYRRLPLSLTMKKPLPLMARSRLRPVEVRLPWVNCCDTDWVITPLPTALRPVPSIEAAYRSANSVREDLKPVVPTLAMLLPVTFRSVLAAFKPLRAVLKDMVSSRAEGRRYFPMV